MIGLELTCVAIVALYVGVRVRADATPARFLRRMGLLMVASWVGENTVIHAYGFYRYSPEWSLFVDRVPIMIVTIWPVVIHSAWDLARHALGPRPSSVRSSVGVALLGGALVLADASLIEPIAVQAGLWEWTQPGLFAVPPIGILGWAFFAALVMFVLTENDRVERPPSGDLSIVLLAPLGTHLLLLAGWWGALRWANHTVPPWPIVAVAWTLSCALAVRMVRRRLYERIPLREMLLRVPAALFFFGLLAVHGREVPALVAYAVAFAPPYVAATPWTPGQRVQSSGG